VVTCIDNVFRLNVLGKIGYAGFADGNVEKPGAVPKLQMEDVIRPQSLLPNNPSDPFGQL
jgi:hypothetical protein